MPPVKGYRELSTAEVDLINKVKEVEAQVLRLHQSVKEYLEATQRALYIPPTERTPTEQHELITRWDEAEPLRWCAIAKTDIQTGFMALVRSIAQPGG